MIALLPQQQVQISSTFGFVGDSAGIKTFKNPVLTIRYPHFTFFQI
jgi:hypothetical protein